MPHINVERGSFGPNVTTFTWTGATNGDTFEPVALHSTEGTVSAIHVMDTFGGATVSLQGTLRGPDFPRNWATIADIAGNRIELTSLGLREFSTAAPFIKPEITGGSGTNVIIVVSVRG